MACFDIHYNTIINLLQQYKQIVNILLTFLNCWEVVWKMWEYMWKLPIKMWRNFKGKFEGLKMAKMTDWSRRRKGWWMGVGMGQEEGRMEGEKWERGGKIWWKWEWLGVVWWWGLMPKKVPKNGSSSKNYPLFRM